MISVVEQSLIIASNKCGVSRIKTKGTLVQERRLGRYWTTHRLPPRTANQLYPWGPLLLPPGLFPWLLPLAISPLLFPLGYNLQTTFPGLLPLSPITVDFFKLDRGDCSLEGKMRKIFRLIEITSSYMKVVMV